MRDPLQGTSSDDPWVQGGRLAEELARALVAAGIGVQELPKLLDALLEAQADALSLRQEVERHESRLDDAAVHAGETMVTLHNAVAELGENREQLVKGNLADDVMLQDLDLQIDTLQHRIGEVKALQSSENRVIEEDLSPDRDRLVAGELARQTATARLIQRVIELKPAPCPPTLQGEFEALEQLQKSL